MYDNIVIPPAVFKEAVIIGAEKGFKDALTAKQAVDIGSIQIKEPSREELARVDKVSNKLGIQLGRGEIEANALATDGLLLIDDEAAYTVAINMGRDRVGTLALLLLMVSRKMISKKRALEALDIMIDAGFWLSPRLVLVFNNKINKTT